MQSIFVRLERFVLQGYTVFVYGEEYWFPTFEEAYAEAKWNSKLRMYITEV